MTLAHDLIDVVIVIAVGPGLWQQLWPAAYIFFFWVFVFAVARPKRKTNNNN